MKTSTITLALLAIATMMAVQVSAQLVVDNGSGMCKAGFADTSICAFCAPDTYEWVACPDNYVPNIDGSSCEPCPANTVWQNCECVSI